MDFNLNRFYKACAFLSFILMLLSSEIRGQALSHIPYQAIARDNSGQIKANAPVQVEFKIFNTLNAASASYDEIHTVTTNDFGYFNLRIGDGAVQGGSFSAINWSTGDVAYEVWADMGLGFSQLGSRTGFLSVPYALYAPNSSATPTITINSPNTVSVPSPGIYNLNVPSPSLSISGSDLSISNGNTVTLPTGSAYTAGNGIAINAPGNVITNTAPDKVVNITGTGATSVTGSYPNFTISSPAVPTYSAGTGISMAGNVVTNTAPDKVVNLTGTGATSVTGSYPNFTINSPAAPTYSAGTGISVAGNVITNTAPDQVVNLTGTGATNVTGSYPNFTINSPAAPTYSAGTGISVAGNVITNTAPDQVVNITGAGVTSVAGSYPNYTVSTAPTPTTSLVQGANIILNNAGTAYTVSAVTPTLTATGNATVSGAYPLQNINVTPQLLSISGNTISLSQGGGAITLPDPVNFGAIVPNGNSVNSSSVTPVPFVMSYNNGGGTFAGGVYTVPVSGVYHIDASVMWNSALLGTNELAVCINGTPANKKAISITGVGTLTESFNLSTDVNVTAGQQISITYLFGGSSVSSTDNTNWWFKAHLCR